MQPLEEIMTGEQITVIFIHFHCDLLMPLGDMDLSSSNIGTGNGLLPDSTKPLSEPMLT